jgi:hypothetical protein
MLLPRETGHLRKALRWTCLLAVCAACASVFGGGWKAVLGVLGGAAAMAGALVVSAIRAAAMFPGEDAGRRKPRPLLARGLWFLGTAVVFYALLVLLRVPGWSVAVGVSVSVAGLVVGFLPPRPDRKARKGQESR